MYWALWTVCSHNKTPALGCDAWLCDALVCAENSTHRAAHCLQGQRNIITVMLMYVGMLEFVLVEQWRV